MKKLVVSMLVVMGVVSILFTGCNTGKRAKKSDKKNSKVNEVFQDELNQAMGMLKIKDDYIIQNQIVAPSGNVYYLEGVTSGASWTDYPVDEKTGNLDGSQDSTKYALVDWIEPSGDAFVSNQDSTGANVWVKYPKAYSDFISSRVVLYADKIIPKLQELTKDTERKKLNLGDGDENFTVYHGKIKSHDIRDILGVNTKVLYESLIDETPTSTDEGKNLIHLCKLYLSDIERTLVFSDGDLVFLVKDGVLRSVEISVGGLGSTLTYIKSVSLSSKYEPRTKPDMGTVREYGESLKELADFSKDYDTYSDLMTAYNDAVKESQKSSADNKKDTSKSTKKSKKKSTKKKTK